MGSRMAILASPTDGDDPRGAGTADHREGREGPEDLVGAVAAAVDDRPPAVDGGEGKRVATTLMITR